MNGCRMGGSSQLVEEGWLERKLKQIVKEIAGSRG